MGNVAQDARKQKRRRKNLRPLGQFTIPYFPFTESLRLADQVIHRGLDVGVWKRGCAALRRHQILALECAGVQRILALRDAWLPRRLVASLGSAGDSSGVAHG